MGWKGAVRSIRAEMRRAEREAQRRQRELEKRRKEFARMQELEQAAYEVEVYENHIALLTSVHQECGPTWNWAKIAARPEPTAPVRRDENERVAQQKFDTFQPSLFTRILGREGKIREKLRRRIDLGRKKDEEAYQDQVKRFEKAHSDWSLITGLASGIMKGDTEAYLEAIDETEPFSDLSTLGSDLQFSVPAPTVAEVVVNVHGEDVIPSEKKSLLKSGKLSIKQMPKGEFFGYYEDYVCGCAIRVAREMTALLPVEFVLVHVVSEMLNPATGHLEEQAILSAAIPKATLEKLNLEYVDPSDSMSNFVHNVAFKKTKGFSPVERLNAEEFASSS